MKGWLLIFSSWMHLALWLADVSHVAWSKCTYVKSTGVRAFVTTLKISILITISHLALNCPQIELWVHHLPMSAHSAASKLQISNFITETILSNILQTLYFGWFIIICIKSALACFCQSVSRWFACWWYWFCTWLCILGVFALSLNNFIKFFLILLNFL